jgi:hypothetical protein
MRLDNQRPLLLRLKDTPPAPGAGPAPTPLHQIAGEPASDPSGREERERTPRKRDER